jgi:ArsR family transcriptional regulator, arsenate/arsenite/antimonite-responsive transcriptional repressor / arsenate reductase (thioredoxin)
MQKSSTDIDSISIERYVHGVDMHIRAGRHAALGDAVRLWIVDELAWSDRSPGELSDLLGIRSNLLAHHLGVLESVGLVDRSTSEGDARRRYVALNRGALVELGIGASRPSRPVIFVCTHNSARSQLAAALWTRRFGAPAASAGTHPAARVHPGAVAAAARAGLDITGTTPRAIDSIDVSGAHVVTVCDRAHEELGGPPLSWHWSIPDPVGAAAPRAFDIALQRIRSRIDLIPTDVTEADEQEQRP